jgi:hypothetical protein
VTSSLLLVWIWWIVGISFGQVLGESQLDQMSVERVAEELQELITAAVAQSGGDVDVQHLHLVFGFSTGHFGIEPIRAQAARQTAVELVDSFLIQGDEVSTYAFEISVWAHPGQERNPFTIPSDHGTEKLAVVELLPITPEAGSMGGHDTELSIVQIAENVDMDTGPVLILFLNRAASITTDL